MQALTYSYTRNRLKEVMDTICRDGETVIVTRKDSKNVVMMSLDEYNAVQETLHLLSSPKNAKRLFRSIREVSEGRTEERNLLE